MSQNLHFNKISRWFTSTLTLGKYCTENTDSVLAKEATEISGNPQVHMYKEFWVGLALSWYQEKLTSDQPQAKQSRSKHFFITSIGTNQVSLI